MILDNAYDILANQLITIGKEELSKLYPRDFEVYMCALELVDQDDNTVDYFMFPVMPRSISKSENEATTIQHSFSGVTIFNKDGYIPDEISIEGDFGRSFKLMSFEQDKYYKGVAGFAIEDGYYTSDQINSGLVDKKTEFPIGVKTGFGCIKILQSIIHKAKAHGPTGISYKLYFYNAALGESYLVIPNKNPLVFRQELQSSNMIWQYNLSLSVIADLSDVQNRSKPQNTLHYSLSHEQILGGVASTKTLMKQYTGLAISMQR
jgi:hypothetical protein